MGFEQFFQSCALQALKELFKALLSSTQMDLHFAAFDWPMLLHSVPAAMCIAQMQKSEQICPKSALILK